MELAEGGKVKEQAVAVREQIRSKCALPRSPPLTAAILGFPPPPLCPPAIARGVGDQQGRYHIFHWGFLSRVSPCGRKLAGVSIGRHIAEPAPR